MAPKLQAHAEAKKARDLADQLPLEGIPAASNLLDAVSIVAGDSGFLSDYVICDVPGDFLPRDWRRLVLNYDGDGGYERFDRRQLEVVAILELAEAIKAGEVFVRGSLSHDQFWERLPPEASDPTAITSYAAERGWPGGADGFVKRLTDTLRREAWALDEAVHKDGIVELGKDGRPIVSPIHGVPPPPSAIELERLILERIPERPVLSALANTQQWAVARQSG